jgi:hypothetical protein
VTDVQAKRAPKSLGYAIVLDVVLVLIFAVSGRSSHAESLSVGGVFTTAWPFLVSLAIGWAASRNWRSPLRLWPNGVCIWVITVMGGMILRVLSGAGTATAFIIVATVVLGVFLLGHRALASVFFRRVQRA